MTTVPIAFVTGANRGLGQGIAVALAECGHRVVVAHRECSDPGVTMRLIEAVGGDAIAASLDVADVSSFGALTSRLEQALAAQWGRSSLDVVINNAGIGLFDPFGDVTVERFDAMVDTNFRGTFFLLQALVPLMADGGTIVNVSTSLTRHVSPGTAVYAATKAAVEALTRSLAAELGPRGIRINTVAPGPTATDFNGGAMRDDPALRETLSANTALGHVGLPGDVASAVVALVSGQMRWVTAERLEVSGGAFL